MSGMPSLNILLMSGGRDRALAAVNLAASGLALGREVRLFLTWESLQRLAEGTLDAAPLPAGLGEGLARAEAALADQAPLADMLKQLREGGLSLYACSNTVEMLGLDSAALEAVSEGISGAAAFLAMAADGQIVTL